MKQSYPLKSICSRLSSGKSIKASEICNDGPYPVFGGNGVRGYSHRFNFEGQCIVVGRQGADCGNLHFFEGRAYMTEHAIVVTTNEKCDINYLYYLMSTMNLRRLNSQSAQPGLSVTTMGEQPVSLPPLPEQKAIGGFLAKIDSKIRANMEINDNLS